MAEKILVSIITVSYNSVNTIERTILSVINQTYTNTEYIIIDGGSTDGTVEVITRYRDKIAYWVSEPDKGIYDAMNKGISYAKGSYIGIINSDDWYERDAVEKILLRSRGGADIIHGNIVYESEQMKLIKPSLDMSRLKNKMSIYHPSVFVKSDIYKRYGTFNTHYLIAADWDLILRFYEKGCTFSYCDTLIAHFSTDGVSSSFNLKQIGERIRLRVAHKNYSIFPVLKDFIIYTFMRVNIMPILLRYKKIVSKKD